MPTTRGPQALDLDSGDTGGEEGLRQSGGPTAHSNLCARDRRVHLSVREEEEEEEEEEEMNIIRFHSQQTMAFLSDVPRKHTETNITHFIGYNNYVDLDSQILQTCVYRTFVKKM